MRCQMKIKQRSTLASLEYGFARLLDFSGSLITFTYEKHPNSADAAAISSDWERVSRDISFACTMEGYKTLNRALLPRTMTSNGKNP